MEHEVKYNIDPKGRISIPSKFREELGLRFYVTKEIDHCIQLRSEEEWQKLIDRINSMGHANKKKYSRFFVAHRQVVEPDKQGRFCISPVLREWAGITDSAVVIAGSDSVEIWNPDRWNEYDQCIDNDDMVEQMENDGF